MDRRDTIKSLLVGGMSGGVILTACQPAEETKQGDVSPATGEYGRTPKEKKRDEELKGETFFSEHELASIAVLCDLILPATSTAGSATDAGVPEFIEFIAKDMTYHQTPMRGGLMWLDHRANALFGKDFMSCSVTQQKQMLDEIAWPDTAAPEVAQGVVFFSRMRNLVLTGYYTTRMGIDDLGYQGNTPNVWDGVPDDVLAAQGLSYDPEWLAKCIDQDKRNETARWDESGNLVN